VISPTNSANNDRERKQGTATHREKVRRIYAESRAEQEAIAWELTRLLLVRIMDLR